MDAVGSGEQWKLNPRAAAIYGLQMNPRIPSKRKSVFSRTHMRQPRVITPNSTILARCSETCLSVTLFSDATFVK
jgi:hypothetical protein